MSPILILSLRVEIRIDTRCFVYFPSNSAGKNRNASHIADQRQVHGQAIGRNQTAVTLHVGQMLEHGGPALQYVNL
jgi:hypothetical protein